MVFDFSAKNQVVKPCWKPVLSEKSGLWPMFHRERRGIGLSEVMWNTEQSNRQRNRKQQTSIAGRTQFFREKSDFQNVVALQFLKQIVTVRTTDCFTQYSQRKAVCSAAMFTILEMAWKYWDETTLDCASSEVIALAGRTDSEDRSGNNITCSSSRSPPTDNQPLASRGQ